MTRKRRPDRRCTRIRVPPEHDRLRRGASALSSLSQSLLGLCLIGLYAYVACTDFSRLKIANSAVVAIAVTAAAVWAVNGITQLGVSLLVGVILFAITFPFWLLGAVGAGDVKLLAASGIAVGLADVVAFAALILLYSVLLLVGISYGRQLFLFPVAITRRFQAFLDDGRIPYGVPIALAAITTIGPRVIEFL